MPNEIESPCINICEMNEANGLCEGCLRNIFEIAGWSKYTDEEKQHVLNLIEERKRNA